MTQRFAATMAASIIAVASASLAAPSWAQETETIYGPRSIQERQFDAVDGAYTQLDAVELWEDGNGPGWTDFAGYLGIDEEVYLGGAAEAVFNVSVPTITPYLPDPERATGTAVIVAPGGGFRLLAMGHEGHKVAEYLAERGVAAFVLKYRLVQLDGIGDYGPSQERVPAAEAAAPGTVDGLRALELVRAGAEEYGIDPESVGMVGYSAGGWIAAKAAMQADLEARPDFVGLIYGAADDSGAIPAPDSAEALPPLFIAGAQNDGLTSGSLVPFAVSLMEAGYGPELHLYRDGNHGFGMTRQGATSDMWADEFFWWMTGLGLTQKPDDPAHDFTPMPPPDLSGD